ncbi:MAG: CPBP family intramembrane metalloprotease [Oligoflexia bacterium]|nr:CPBP family intramembrane metalloprotease [Oligoflexia bacterium]
MKIKLKIKLTIDNIFSAFPLRAFLVVVVIHTLSMLITFASDEDKISNACLILEQGEITENILPSCAGVGAIEEDRLVGLSSFFGKMALRQFLPLGLEILAAKQLGKLAIAHNLSMNKVTPRFVEGIGHLFASIPAVFNEASFNSAKHYALRAGLSWKHAQQLSDLLAGCMAAPLGEEVFFRYLLQEMLLKRVPIAILASTFPQFASWLNSPVAQMLRVVFTAAAFSMAHYPESHTSQQGGGLPQFTVGLAFGAQMEMHGDLQEVILNHALHNLSFALLGASFNH